MKKPVAITLAVAGGVLVLLLILGGILTAVGYKPPSSPPPAAASPATSPARSHPARSAAPARHAGPAAWRVTRFAEITNPATLTVSGYVTNTGGSPGTPSCDITASDPGGSYYGFDTITAKNPVRPGRRVYFTDPVTITNQGARYVTSVKVSCRS